MKRYLKIWWILTTRTTQIAFATRFGAAIFVIGKILRFFFFLLFLVTLVSKTDTIAGYTIWQVVFFYATFTLLDSLPQFFLRDVYRFRYQVVNGYFDHVLLKPWHPLLKALFGGTDMLDLTILSLSVIFLGISIQHIGGISLPGILLYLAFIVNSFIIALAFHICVVALGVITTEVDNAIMLYRDLTQMGRVPIDVYLEPLRGIITFIIPVGIMMTFPAKALLGLLSWQLILLSFCISGVLLFVAIKFWNYSLGKYSSASS